jgi:fumarate reductase subunit C
MATAITKTEGPHSATTYTEYHPRWYRPRVSVYWWMGQWHYLKFILREISSVFVGIFVVMTLFQLGALPRGPEAYASFQQWLKTPLALAINLVSFFFVVFHAITWFNLTPHAMAVRVKGQRMPDWMVAAPNYVAWAAISAFVAWIIWR